MSDQDALNAGLDVLRQRFLARLAGQIKEVYDASEAAVAEGNHAAAFERISRIGHKISGSSGTLGYTDLGEKARQVEDLWHGEMTPDDELRFVDAMAAMLEEAEQVIAAQG